ncbi:MAG: hypothetical protein J3Q66DRAFT_341165 [Benniella sp.]|nr:MAG: hypothetical protein J3Q66DRAFT_341165 [Benniella sp.]
MAALIRSAASLPRVPMARIPLAALATSHIAPMSHANSAHPSAFSSMPSTRKGASNWAQSANTIADKLEDSAEKLSQDYLREVKQFDSTDDKMAKKVGTAMNTSSSGDNHHQEANKRTHHNQSGGKNSISSSSTPGSHLHGTSKPLPTMTTFEQSLVDQVQANVIHPARKTNHQQHHQEMVFSLLEELKADKSNLSKHASDAIRMVESHHVLKQDRAPIHDVSNEDPSEKDLGSQKHA